MHHSFLIVIILNVSVFSDGSVNYCGARMCAHTNTHTFCQYPPGPGSLCRGYTNAPLTPAEKSRILERLNRRRSDIARGLQRLPTAGDMLKLRWIEELAREAQRWADQCIEPKIPEQHDTCRDLYSISVGQCVASVVGEAPGLRPETMVDMWYIQSKYYKGNATSYIPSKTTFNYYGDFAQITWSRTYMVGCGRSVFMISKHGRLRTVQRLVCNFAPRGPIPFRPLWASAIPASLCPPRSRSDDNMPELCDFQRDMDETLDEDNLMSLQEHLLLNTVFEIDKNISREYKGSFDEIYLTKLAVATIESNLDTSSLNSVEKRHIDLTGNRSFAVNETGNTENFHIKLPTIMTAVKKKNKFIGRPKPYNIEDLNDFQVETINENYIEKISQTQNILDDYDFNEIISTEHLTTVASSTVLQLTLNDPREQLWLRPESTVYITKEQTINTNFIPENVTISSSIAFEDSEMYNDIISNLNIPQILNKSDEEILNDPETMRQLEEALNQMENKLADPVHSEKVRRELKSSENSSRNNLNNSNLKELERNKTLGRGPMLNMVLKYLPYLKPYEKSIMGDITGSGASSSLHHYYEYVVIINVNILSLL